MRKTTHERCLPRVKTIGKAAEAMAAPAMTCKTVVVDSDPRWARRSSKAKAHQATVVMCHAKRSVPSVNSVPPKSFGTLPRLNRRIRMYRSPKYECAHPVTKMSAAAMRSIEKWRARKVVGYAA